MDIGLIGLMLGIFSGTALVGAYSQTTGGNLRYKAFPPDKTGSMVMGVSIAFIFAYLYAREGGIPAWSAWQVILFIALNTASSAFGYMFGFLAMQYMKRNDDG